VLIFGPSTNNALSLLNGLQGDQPLPWKRTTLTPNIGRQDATDDMRGGLELQGILNLSNFVKAGGTLITLQKHRFSRHGLATNVSIRRRPTSGPRRVPRHRPRRAVHSPTVMTPS
jgi:hypothetical protein